ncbi:conserved exported protein of unknown function [Pseudomonas marincola]|uniref:Neuromedin U n=1 Tax=Pseudomonas marincola TaxID=437900 RepID=A0A653E1B3_9PSED|nr:MULTISPECIES: hypothetical protein [Pseudomonas]CAE6953205.1 conserved exported protein of unknown function [Pseudomonas marincola]
MITRLKYPLAAAAFALSQGALSAEETTDSAAQANNPLANMTAFNLQNYYIGELTESDKSADQFWFRYAKPFSVGESNWLLRASLPINSFPSATSSGRTTGIGDLNLFAAYLIDTGDPAVSFGVGPQLTARTATDDELGSEKWSGGLVNVLFNASSPKFQYGYLLSWQQSFAGNESREDVNIAAFQPFAFYQLGGGTYLRAAPIWTYNIENDNYSVPLGLGIGQVFKQKKTVYNFFIEPQVSVADRGPGQPEWQVFMSLNLQFLD